MLRFFTAKIQHLTRYFIVLGLLVFALYWMKAAENAVLALIGVPLYISHGIKQTLLKVLPDLPSSSFIHDFAFVLPVTVSYFGIIGFQLKQLWNERGPARFLTISALVIFLVFIHAFAFRELSGYFTLGS